MSLNPLVLLTFANDADAHLPLLKQESKDVFQALRELDRKEIIRVHREESADSNDMYRALVSFKDQVSIFHYGGHAGGSGLRLEDAGGDAQGIAKLLGEQEQLKLVFLNGCSTKAQVEGLLEAGVPAVIATAVPIQDKKAVEFSRAFYEALANRRTIRQAFNLAAAFLETRYSESVSTDIVHYRRFDWKPDKAEATFPWGLYVKDDQAEDALSYQLPYYRSVSLPKEVIQYIGQSFTTNRYILLALDEMCQYNPDIYTQMVEHKGDQIIKKDSKDYPELIIRNFPWPIGSQIRLLRLKAQPNRERLEILISTYVITTQLLYYILLSDLWEQHHSGTMELQKWPSLLSGEHEFLTCDFLAGIQLLYAHAKAQKVMLFVPEFELLTHEISNEASRLYKAYQYLESLRKQVMDKSDISEIEKTCMRAEQAVAVLLKQAAFLARFRMITVRNVSIDNPRFAPLAYELNMGPLNASEGVNLRLYQDVDRRRKTSFANSQSVVLVSDEDRMHQSLNLSPFIMDKNTFVQVKKSTTTEEDIKDVAHIFLLGWEANSRLTYLTVNHSLFVALENEKGTDQVHTDMRQEDFTEGKNLGDEDEFDLDFGFGFEETTETESPGVFTLLKEQYDLFKAEIQA